MRRIICVLAGLVIVLAGAVISGARTDDQKEKAKAKDKEKTVEKERIWAPEAEPPQAFAIAPLEGGHLGVFVEEVTPERAKELGLSEERGAVIMKIVADGPAEKAGLKENDVIVGFNGRRVDSVRELQRLLTETPAGRNVSIEVIRGSSHQTVTAQLGKRSPEFRWRPELDEQIRKSTEDAMLRAQEQLKLSEDLAKRGEELKKLGPEYQEEMNKLKEKFRLAPGFGDFFFVGPGEFRLFRGGRLGVSTESLTSQLAGYFGVRDGKGALVTQVTENSAGAKAGLKAGDVIIAVDNEPIDGVNSLIRELNKKEEGQVSLRIVRDKTEQTITVTLEKRERLVRPVPPRRKVAMAAAN